MLDSNNAPAPAMVELTSDEMATIEGGGVVSFVGKVLSDIKSILSTGEDGAGGRGIAGGYV
jgi:hypothetical protein